ncbi:MAG: protein TolR [Pseudomonadota bacterium]|nr:protein TolR [Pseudomonadota bacterium]
MRSIARKRMMSEINVVPYIDVILVLLIIFMITAPLITQGVKVELPSAPADVLPPSDTEPVVVTVDELGKAYVDVGDKPEEALADQLLVTRVAAVLRYKPNTRILIRGDKSVPYGRVVEIMAMLQGSGVKNVGMITEPASSK